MNNLVKSKTSKTRKSNNSLPVHKKEGKQAAIELSMSTIVVIVIAVIMLIFGIVFVRSIMCAGIVMTDKISTEMQNKITEMFGADKVGVKCLGEGSQVVKFGSGGPRRIICMIRTEDTSKYKLTVKSVESKEGASDSSMNKWIKDKNWEGSVSPGDTHEAVILYLDIPRDAPKSTMKITTESTRNDDPSTKDTHISYIDVVTTNLVQSAIC